MFLRVPQIHQQSQQFPYTRDRKSILKLTAVGSCLEVPAMLQEQFVAARFAQFVLLNERRVVM